MLKSSHIHFTGDIHVHINAKAIRYIFIGERNTAVGWSAHAKSNNVIGSIGGQRSLFTTIR